MSMLRFQFNKNFNIYDVYKARILKYSETKLENDKQYLIASVWSKSVEDKIRQSSLSEEWKNAKTFGDEENIVASFIAKELGVDQASIGVEGSSSGHYATYNIYMTGSSIKQFVESVQPNLSREKKVSVQI